MPSVSIGVYINKEDYPVYEQHRKEIHEKVRAVLKASIAEKKALAQEQKAIDSTE